MILQQKFYKKNVWIRIVFSTGGDHSAVVSSIFFVRWDTISAELRNWAFSPQKRLIWSTVLLSVFLGLWKSFAELLWFWAESGLSSLTGVRKWTFVLTNFFQWCESVLQKDFSVSHCLIISCFHNSLLLQYVLPLSAGREKKHSSELGRNLSVILDIWCHPNVESFPRDFLVLSQKSSKQVGYLI